MEQKTTNQFDNSRLLDIHRWSNFPQVVNAIDELCSELGFKDKRFKKCLRMVIIDLYQAWRVDPTQYLSYSRGENDYRGGTRYNKLRIKYNVLTKTVDALKEGFIEHHIGGYFYNEKTGTYYGHVSRMRATKMLIRYIVSHGIKSKMISRYEDEELIVKRAETVKIKKGNKTVKVKDDIEYNIGDEPDRITTARKDLVAYNSLLEKTYIDVDDEHLTEDEQRKLRQYRLDLSRKRVHRVFNNDSWEEGGRFYGSWWMDCPKILRQYIVINGQSTVELDYSGIHIHLLYAIEKINYAAIGEDAYAIEGFPHRGLNKYVFLIAVNAEGEDDCVKGVWKRLVDQKKLKEYGISKPKQIKDVLNAIKAKHPRIAQHIASGYGVKLQYIDSCMAENVVNFFTKRNIPILTVHDSFICSKLDRMTLLDQMQLAYTAEIKKLLKFKFVSEMDEIRYDTGLIQVRLDNNDPVIEVDSKELPSERWTVIRSNLKLYSQGRRELRWRMTVNPTVMTKLTNIIYSGEV
jgi:hypothetical protein